MAQKKIDYFLQTKRKRDEEEPICNSRKDNQGKCQQGEKTQETLKRPAIEVEANRASSVTGKGKEKYEKARTVKPEWFKIFPWLIHSKEDNVFRCKDCMESKLKNIFVTGKSAEKPKRDDFSKHEKTEDHRRASRAKNRSREMKEAVLTANEKAKAAVIASMRTIMCLVQEDIPSSKTQAIIELQIANGSSMMKDLKAEDGSVQYTHHQSVNEMQRCLADTIEETVMSDIENAEFFSLEADEATDAANKSVLIVCIRYIKDSKPVTSFLGVKDLQNTCADQIVKVLDTLLIDKGLPPSKLVGMATDGASVMRGTCTGVVTQFKKKAPFMLANHCMAHRLQLAAQKAANQIKEVQRYIGNLNTFARCLKFSPKLDRAVQTAKDLNDEKSGKIKQVFFTRWLSFADSTQALAGCIPSVISALNIAAADKGDREGRAQLHGLAYEMATFKFVKLTHFLADAAGYLAILNRSMQVSNPTYENVRQQIDACICAIKSLQTHPGPHMSKLNGVFPKDSPKDGYTEWGKHTIKDTSKQREKYERTVEEFIEAVMFRLETTFPDRDIMGGFSLFSGEGNADSLDQLLMHYGTDKKVDKVTQERLVDPEEARKEWTLVQPFAAKYHDMASLYERFLVMHMDVYPNISRLVSIGLTIPVTSVNCERGISRYNAIKTDSRSRMNTENVEMLIHLSSSTEKFTEFNYEGAWAKWLSKGRKGMTSLKRRCEKSDAGIEIQCDVHMDLEEPLDLSRS